jgi:hemerythrin
MRITLFSSMKYIEWTPAIRTGVSSIDVQHKALIHAINDLGKELEEGRGEASIKKTVSFLKYYTEWHFGQEEDCAAKHQCPIAETNKQAHAKFIAMIDKLVSDLQNTDNPEGVAKEAHALVCDWIEHHIMKIDKQVGDCVTNHSAHKALSMSS